MLKVHSFIEAQVPRVFCAFCVRWIFSAVLQLAKGQMLGGSDGFLKLIFDTSTLKLLGVHAFGEGATEIVHIGQVRVGRRHEQRRWVVTC